MLVAEEPTEVVPMGISRSVRATEIGVSRSDNDCAGAAAAVEDANDCSACGSAVITCEPLDMDD